MGIRDLIAAHVKPDAWQGASVGTLVSIWWCHILTQRDHRLVAVRDWVAQRAVTFQTLLDTTLRDTDCTDDRLTNVLSMLGHETTQASLDQAMLQRSSTAPVSVSITTPKPMTASYTRDIAKTIAPT